MEGWTNEGPNGKSNGRTDGPPHRVTTKHELDKQQLLEKIKKTREKSLQLGENQSSVNQSSSKAIWKGKFIKNSFLSRLSIPGGYSHEAT